MTKPLVVLGDKTPIAYPAELGVRAAHFYCHEFPRCVTGTVVGSEQHITNVVTSMEAHHQEAHRG